MTSIPPPNQRAGSVYRSYLVRIWQEHADTPPRASAKPVDGCSTVRFATLDALFAWLEAQSTSISLTADRPADADDSEDDQ